MIGLSFFIVRGYVDIPGIVFFVLVSFGVTVLLSVKFLTDLPDTQDCVSCDHKDQDDWIPVESAVCEADVSVCITAVCRDAVACVSASVCICSGLCAVCDICSIIGTCICIGLCTFCHILTIRLV